VSQQLPGSEEAGFFLTTIFPANQLAILDYNRVAKDLNGLSSADFSNRLENNFSLEKKEAAVAPKELHQFGMYLDKQWYSLKRSPALTAMTPSVSSMLPSSRKTYWIKS
jgi:uncharacterized protein (DUF1015 family)